MAATPPLLLHVDVVQGKEGKDISRVWWRYLGVPSLSILVQLLCALLDA